MALNIPFLEDMLRQQGQQPRAPIYAGDTNMMPQMQQMAPIQAQEVNLPRKRGIGNVLADFFSAEQMAARRPLSNALGMIGDSLGALKGVEPYHRNFVEHREAQERAQAEWQQKQDEIARQNQARQMLGQVFQNASPENMQQLAQISPEQAFALRQQQQEAAQAAQKPLAFGNTLIPRTAEGGYDIERAQSFGSPWGFATGGDQPFAYNKETGATRPVGPPKQKPLVLRTNAEGQTQAFNPVTGQPVGRPVGPKKPVSATAAGVSPGQKAVDQAFGKDYAAYVAQGGFADVQKGVRQLREARQMLEKGGVTGGPTGYLPTWARSVVNEPSVNIQEAVEEVVQRNLRAVLGAQFTEKEGTRLIERSYNPRLSEKENIKRLDRLITQIETAAKSRESAARYFEKNGTLQGWKGSIPSLDDFTSNPPAPRKSTAAGGWKIEEVK